MTTNEVGLHDTIMSIRKRYRITYDEILHRWRHYAMKASGFHTPSTDEFHILFMEYLNTNSALRFGDYVDLELTEKGRVTIDEVLL